MSNTKKNQNVNINKKERNMCFNTIGYINNSGFCMSFFVHSDLGSIKCLSCL